jgi:hypothetical protein
VSKQLPKGRGNLTLAQQAAWLDRMPTWDARVSKGVLSAKGRVRPDPLCREYVVQISYRLPKSPTVRLVDPPLEQRECQWPDHIYSGRLLCLYNPRRHEWDGADLISETIVPWISEWLYFYEIWLATGDWLGGGEHPPRKRQWP